jgi:hypothetical protein
MASLAQAAVLELREELDGLRLVSTSEGTYGPHAEDTDTGVITITGGQRLVENSAIFQLTATPGGGPCFRFDHAAGTSYSYEPISVAGFTANYISGSWGSFLGGFRLSTSGASALAPREVRMTYYCPEHSRTGEEPLPVGGPIEGVDVLLSGSFGEHGIIPGLTRVIDSVDPPITLKTVATASLEVVLASDPASGADVTFTAAHAGSTVFEGDSAFGDFVHDAAAPDDGDGVGSSRLITGVMGDVYTITAAPPPGWAVTAASCTGGSDAGVLDGNTLTVTIKPREALSCTFRTAMLYQIDAVATPPEGGTVACDPTTVAHGGNSTCTASTNDGFTFDAWSGDCGGSISGDTYTTDAVTANCTVEARFVDITPDAFSFTNQTGVALNTVIASNTITVSGISTATPISIASCTGTNCQYAINGSAWTGDAGMVNNGDTVQVRQIASGSYSTYTSLTLDIGGVTDTFSIWTGAAPPPPPAPAPAPEPEPEPDPEPYNDGTVACSVASICTASDNEDGSRTISGSLTDPVTGGAVTFMVTTHPSDPNGGVDITLTTADGTTRVSSAVPGSSVEVGTDENGRPQVTTHAELPDGTTLEVVVDADGYLTHRVTHLDGTVTETVVSLGGAEVAIDAVGRLTTSYQVEHGEALWRMVVETNADGTAVARYERFDAVTGEWVTERQLTDPISPLEAGHRVWMENVPGIGLRLRARIPVSSSLYF